MAYAVVADVQAEFKDIDFSSTTSVKDTEVTQFLAEAAAEIDSIIGVRYVVPVVSDAAALLNLKTISIWLVKDRLKDILHIKQLDDRLDQDVAPPTSLRQNALAWLNRIAKGIAYFNAPLVEVAGTTGGAMDSYNKDLTVERSFEKDRDDW